MTNQPFTTSIVPVYYVNKLCGLAPFSRTKTGYSANLWSSLYTVAIIIFYWGAFCATIIQRLRETDQDISLRQSTDCLQLAVGCICQTVCWVYAILMQSNVAKSFNAMNAVDVKLHKVCAKNDYQITQCRVLKQECLVWSSGIAFCAMVNAMAVKEGQYTAYYYWLTCYGPLSGLWAFVSLYSNYTMALRRRFKAINKQLKEFKLSKQVQRPKIECIYGKIIQVQPAPNVKRVQPGMKFLMPVKATHTGLIAVEDNLTDTRTLQIVSNIHDNLCELCKRIMVAYGVPSLASIAFIFITTTCQMFVVLVLADDQGRIELIANIMWLLLYVSPLVVLCGTCHFCAEEANSTGHILHSIQNYGNYNGEFRTAASLFSLQLIHHKINFTAQGFFNIDFTLLQTILGATTTYLVILLQFNAGLTGKTSTDDEKKTL